MRHERDEQLGRIVTMQLLITLQENPMASTTESHHSEVAELLLLVVAFGLLHFLLSLDALRATVRASIRK